MSLPVLVEQSAEIHMGVALRGREPRMSEQLLDCPKIRPGREQMRGEAVPKTMGRDRLSGRGGQEMPIQKARHAPARKTGPLVIQKKRGVASALFFFCFVPTYKIVKLTTTSLTSATAVEPLEMISAMAWSP